ncbi:DUF2490 domain-containing protein [Aestuariivivens marinum]|uniref:DUF2490 domain-containing protein n=1 Tax=Aestuariivivens marinum TaxID=2913555 RepID=UPI001F57E351|nr:DUF2490 domain-containing protein [Aestuariivivens marinum]
MKKTTILLGVLLTACYSYAQINPEDKWATWYGLGGNYRISEKSSIETFTYLWHYELNDNFNFLLLNFGYNYHFNPKLTGTVFWGYADIDSEMNMSSPHSSEIRLAEQVAFKHKLSTIPLDHRFRIEHRFLRKPNSKQNVARLRYRLGTKFNLNKILFVRIHNEILLSPKLENSSENRFYSGLGFNISKSNNIQLGYMNRNTPNKDNLHRIQMALFIKIDFRKNKN